MVNNDLSNDYHFFNMCVCVMLFSIILLQEMESTFTQLNSARVYI